MSIFQGELPTNEREKLNLAEKAFGGVWWSADQTFVHGIL
jgi:hypothetical protein